MSNLDTQRFGSGFPLTALQQAYYVGSRADFDLHVAPRTYFEFEYCALDLTRLDAALTQVVRRHDALRAVLRDDGNMAVLSEVPHGLLIRDDFRALDADDAQRAAAATRARMSRADLDLSSWPCFEFRASLLPGDKTRLHVNVSPVFMDGRSVALVFAEISRLYADPDAALAPNSFSLRDYALFHNQRTNDKRYRRARDYWMTRLGAFPPPPALALQDDVASVCRSRLQRRRTVLDATTWSSLKQRVQQNELTPAAVLLTAYATVVATWSRQSHFSLTMLIQRRDNSFRGIEHGVGNFSSVLLVEIDLREPVAFVDHARAVHRQLFQDMLHAQVCGLEVMQERNRLNRSLAQAASPVAFVCNLDEPASGIPCDDILHRQGKYLVSSNLETPQVWLDHQAAVNWDGGLALNWDSLEHRFPAGAAREMFEAYVRLLADLSGNDSTWTESRRTLTPASQLAAFERANATDWPLSELCLQQLFYRQCAQTPDAPAIVTADVRIRYRELHASVAALAKRLTPYHLRPGELVAVMMRKGPEQIAACLAIQTAGAAYVPIDPDLPAERIRWLMQRCDVRVVLSQSALDGHAGLPSNDVIFVDRVLGGSEEDCQDVARQTPNDLAYAIFTSGSTGTPKGVVLDHRGPVNTVLDINHRFGVTANDRIFAISSLSFDLSVYDLFGGLAAGAALVMPSAERLKEPAHWHDLIVNQRVTVWNSAPALMQMYVDYLADQGLQLPATLRLIMLSGDWIPLSLAKKIRQARPDIRFISLGGATEASIWSIFHEVEHIDPGWRSVPYGKALANQKFFVFDEQLRYRPVGVPGALYIGGVGLAKGYWREPELTSKVFVTHPVTGEPLYRTGDLGRYFEDGSIEFLGREDFQVKLQGYRVELGEIEHCLGRHVSVDTALVTVVGNSTATARLVAYVVPVRGHTCTPRELIDHASRTLPHYMVPMTFVFLDRFPVTANGKIDRKALPQPGAERRGGESSTAAASPTEQAVLSIWRDLLENQEVGVHDNFFDLGGQSFLAVRMMSRVQREFHVTLPISTLLQHPTAALLARHIEESRGPTATQHDPVVVIKSSGRAAPLVLVHPVGGSVLCYQELATALGALDRPILALQAAPSEGSAEVTIENLAARYVDAVRRRQPQGPYCLGGWSLGGVVAVEMARQLSAAGERVSNLILIDTPLSRATDAPVEGELAAWFFRDATQGRYAGTAAERESWDDHLKHALDLGLLSADTDANALRQHYAVFRDNALALSRYHPSPLAADVPAFTLRATETLADRHAIPHAPDDMTGGWKEFLGAGTRGVQCDGNHYSIMQGSRVRTLAAHIEQLLRGAHDD